MATFKQKNKFFWGYVWQMFKNILPALFMYLCAGAIIMMITLNAEIEDIRWSTKNQTWSIICILGAAAYNMLIAWAQGGSNYEMLVSGNVKRSTEDMYGSAYKMSSHKIAKEYRPWKGFLAGGMLGLLPLIFGIVFGINQSSIHVVEHSANLSPWHLIAFLCSGWSLLPIFCMNLNGANVSYFISCLFALIPIAVHGGMYIAGAYSRRNKAIRQQMIADKAAEAEANREKKINYGGLPGTKPKKKRK